MTPTEARRSTGPTTSGTGIVVSPHDRATAAGIDVLRSGGNAVDAAIATDAMLGVVLPDTCGPGGDLFALLHRPGMAAPMTLNSSGRAGSGVTADDLRDRDLGEIPYRSPWSVSVPGCVDGWLALSDRYGDLPLARLLEPAIDAARTGFTVSAELGATLARIRDLVGAQASAGELYPDGEPAAAGATITRPAFADTLERIATEGRDGFYAGPVAEGIVAATEGAVTPDDLARDQADWIDPVGLDLFGRTAWTIPPNSQGYLTLATLWIFDALGPPTDPDDPAYVHALVEAYRSVAWERADTVGDPDFAEYRIADLLDPARLAARADRIRLDSVTRWPMPEPAPGGTAYMTVLDGSGMGISFIQSNFAGIGSGLSAGATGVWLHNRGAGFNLIPGHPNEYAPGKRPLHTLSPTLWTTGDELSLLLGTRGGDQQPQYLGQYAVHHLHAHLDSDAAHDVARWSMEQPVPGTDSALRIESTASPATVEGLRSRGHVVDIAERHEAGWGPISAIDVAGRRAGSADPRVSTATAAAT